MNLVLNIFDQDGSPLVIDIGGISINGDTNTLASDSHSLAVADNGIAELIVSQDGYASYSLTIDNVYKTDKTISIYLSQILNIVDAQYNRIAPRFFTFLDPCSFSVDYYKANSGFGETSWYINNELLGTGSKGTFKTNSPTILQLKIREYVEVIVYSNGVPVVTPLWDKQFATMETGNTVKGDLDPIETYLVLDLDTNIQTIEYRPDFSVEVSTAASINLQEDICYVRGETAVIDSIITLNRPNALESQHTLRYTVEDPIGNTVIDITTPLDIASPIELELLELGSYTLTTTLTDLECGNKYTRVNELETCNFIDIQYKDCNTFEIFNRSSFINATVSVESIDKETILDAIELNAGESVIANLGEVSLYIVRANYTRVDNPIEEFYLINNYCQVEDCLSDYIENILCGKEAFCDPCPDDVTLNQIMLLMYTFFMKINKLYAFNNFYSGLEDSNYEEFNSINSIGNKLKEFCERRGCLNSNTSAFAQQGSKIDWTKSNTDCNCS